MSLSNLRLGNQCDVVDALEYCMAEITRNVVQHSSSEVGGIAIAQYFPERRAIQIAVADSGKGVCQALRPMYPEITSDKEALKLAVLPHVSGAFHRAAYSAPDNAGLGLFFTKEICWRSGGSFWIASGDALLGIRELDTTPGHRIERSTNKWQGTLVTLDIPESGVSDFSSILSVCRDLSDKARMSSGATGVDFLRAIPDLQGVRILKVGPIKEDVNAAATLREDEILPAIKGGEMLIIDFSGIRFVTQSFAHALLHDAFKIPGSIVRLSFVNCSHASEEAIRTVAAYAASYNVCVNR